MFEKWVGWDTGDLAALERNALKAKELGLDGISVGFFVAEPTLNQIEFPDDPYTQYTISNSSIFKFVEAGVFTGIYPKDALQKNFDALKRKCEIIGAAGIKARLAVMDPQFMLTSFYKKRPDLKGPRVDHPSRSKHEYFAPCIDKEDVLAAYREGTRKIVEACPAISRISVFTNDSGSGLCWCENLYPGKNGPDSCRGISVGDRVAKFLAAIRDGAREGGARDIRVTMEPHGFTNGEILDCVRAMPEACGLYFVTRSLKEGRPAIRGHLVPLEDGVPVLPREFRWEGALDFGQGTPPAPFCILEMLWRAEDMKAASVWADIGAPVWEEGGLDVNTEIWGAAREKPPRTEAERMRAVESIPQQKGLGKCADALVSAWRQVDHAIKTWPRAGMGLTYYGSLMCERWLTRPIVPVPARLTKDEYSYYINYIMCAGGLEVAHLLDQDGPGRRLVEDWRDRRHLTSIIDMALMHVEDALGILREASVSPRAGSREKKCLADQLDRVGYLKCFMRTQKNILQGQGLIDKHTTQYRKEYDELKGLDRGAFLKVVDDEIDNTRDWIRLLKKHPAYVPTVPAARATMYAFGDDLVGQMEKKITIMERHKTDADELFKGWKDKGEFADGKLPKGW